MQCGKNKAQGFGPGLGVAGPLERRSVRSEPERLIARLVQSGHCIVRTAIVTMSFLSLQPPCTVDLILGSALLHTKDFLAGLRCG
jgi:hypothetical protein